MILGRGPPQYYATVDLGPTRVGRTRVLATSKDLKDPVWNETFHIYCAHTVSQVVVSIKDASIVGTTVVGRAKLPVIELLSGQKIDRQYELVNDHFGPIKNAGIRFSLQFFEANRDKYWGRGVLDPLNPGIPFCYFPQRKGCHVTLYQDAHMTNNFLPPIYLGDGQVYQPHRCWEDIFEAINNAQRLIYITGWSVNTEIKLCRDPWRPRPGDEGLTIGELLKKKADQGVRVNVMVWDDRSSFWLRQTGVMSTHDEETALYFRGTNVNCFLCPRDADSNLTLLQKSQIGGLFTHHQKTVIVDAALPGANPFSPGRRIISFVGGLDLCDGRYDDQYHSLFRTLDTAHNQDLHQVFTEASLACGGPREPWHDIHSRLEGPVAWDVLYNFEQRWKKQAGHHRESDLLPIKELLPPPEAVTSEEDPETWNVQVFRSIDAGAAYGFPTTPEGAAELGLVSGKDITIDRSIHDAYINAIRRARNFIYIENQYFLGSSFGWDSKQEAGAFNLIPMEIIRKIVSKIEAGERFCVYIVIPLYPEGVPDTQSVQAILDWQRRTFQMMYKEIAEALSAQRIIDQHPREYLTVFCLGNRETQQPGELVPYKIPQDPYYRSAQVNRRFMVYVHSKMMIVDDEYIIVGSANINERSLNGARDSEIAMGAYQPHHLATYRPALGQIHGFRMSLWFEHLGCLYNNFLEPQSVQCIRQVNEIADKNLKLFLQEEVVDLPGHLMAYPYSIGRDGSLDSYPGCERIPDCSALVLGCTAFTLPEILTT